MEQVLANRMTVKQAAEILNLSERQIKRLKKGMGQEGISFLAHKNRGRKPKHATPETVREMVVSLALEKLKGASCEHMTELLRERHTVELSSRTIRRILDEAGVKNPHAHKVSRKRRSRNRHTQEGMLVQCDASPYAWLEERGPKKLTLHGMIDDATGKVLALYFRPNEDLYGYLQALKQLVSNYGVPAGLYSDGHTIFFSPNKDKLSLEEELAGKKVSLTQFGKVLEELGVNHIHARSPQAKGRVERLWGTLQSRLMVEMRLEGISTLDEANVYLPKFMERFNGRFAVAAVDPLSAFKPTPPVWQLQRMIAFKEERTASNGSTISFYSKLYRLVDIEGTVMALTPRSKVTVILDLEGSMSAIYREKSYLLEEFTPVTTALKPEVVKMQKKSSKKKKPAAEHPWRRMPVARHQDPVEAYLELKGYRFKHYF